MTNRLILTAVLAVGTMLAQGPGGPGRPRGMMGGPAGPGGAMAAGMPGRGAALGNADALKTALGLTDAQVQQLRDLRTQQAEAAKPVMEQIRAKRQALAEAMKAASPDSVLIGQLMVDIRKLNDSLKAASGEREAKALAVLTPEQKTKLTALQEAQKLMPAVGQASALGLLAPPADATGPGRGMPGGMARRAPGMAGRGPRQ